MTEDPQSKVLSLKLLEAYPDDTLVGLYVISGLTEADLINHLLEDRKTYAHLGNLGKVPRTCERLPSRKDLDDKGRCWLSTTLSDPGWVLDDPEQCTGWTHWLPHYYIPVAS